jgi:hypothetical protein
MAQLQSAEEVLKVRRWPCGLEARHTKCRAKIMSHDHFLGAFHVSSGFGGRPQRMEISSARHRSLQIIYSI